MDKSVETCKFQEETFYKHAANYWSNIPATVDGMLGGFGFISHTDIQGSSKFLQQLFKMKDAPGHCQALDCGAGIGRVTKHLLIPHFDRVDLVEQNPVFLEQAREYIGPCKKLGELFNCGLQDFMPEEGKYDVIWSQWVLGHLTDDHLVLFFKACMKIKDAVKQYWERKVGIERQCDIPPSTLEHVTPHGNQENTSRAVLTATTMHQIVWEKRFKGLKNGGVIVVKENLTSSGTVETDTDDSSVTRPPELLLKLFQQAGLHCFREQKQVGFPSGLYPVKMFALRPPHNHQQENS